MPRLPTHLKNSIYVLAARATELVAGILIVGTATRYLGAHVFGEYAFIGATAVALSTFIAMGCARILIRDIAVRGDRAASLMGSAVWLTIGLTGLACLTMAAILWGVGMRSGTILAAGSVAVAAQGLLVLRRNLVAVPMARELMVFDAVVTITVQSVLLVLVFGVVAMRLSYVHFFISSAIAAGVGAVLAWVIVARRFAPPAGGVRLAEIRYLLKESVPVALYNFLASCPVYVSVFLLQCLQDVEQLSFFQAPARVVGPLMMLPMALLSAFTPAMARMGADPSRFGDVRQSYQWVLRGVMVVVMPACLLVGAYAPQWVLVLFGKEFGESGASLAIQLCAIVPGSLNAFLTMVLTSLRRQRAVVFANLAALAVGVTAAPWLVARHGHRGASIAVLITMFCFVFFNHARLSAQVGHVPVWGIVWRPLLAAIGMAAALKVFLPHGTVLQSFMLAPPVYGVLALGLRVVTVRECRTSLQAARSLVGRQRQRTSA